MIWVIATATICSGLGFLGGSYFMCMKMHQIFVDRALAVGAARVDAISHEVIWKDDRVHYILEGE